MAASGFSFCRAALNEIPPRWKVRNLTCGKLRTYVIYVSPLKYYWERVLYARGVQKKKRKKQYDLRSGDYGGKKGDLCRIINFLNSRQKIYLSNQMMLARYIIIHRVEHVLYVTHTHTCMLRKWYGSLQGLCVYYPAYIFVPFQAYFLRCQVFLLLYTRTRTRTSRRN